MCSFRSLFAAAVLTFACPASAESAAPPASEPARQQSRPASDSSPKEARKAEACEHGVKKTICTRCNPKLAAVFKQKGDWCAEHERPESQCVLCHPELAKQGVK